MACLWSVQISVLKKGVLVSFLPLPLAMSYGQITDIFGFKFFYPDAEGIGVGFQPRLHIKIRWEAFKKYCCPGTTTSLVNPHLLG